MSYYSTTPLDDRTMRAMTGAECIGYGAGESHAAIIQRAGGEIGYDGFRDPRPGKAGGMVADRVFINPSDNSIQGINFSKNGEFCCSYTGTDYRDIKDSNQRDCMEKRQSASQTTDSKTLQKQRGEGQTEALSSRTPMQSNSVAQSTGSSKNNKIKH